MSTTSAAPSVKPKSRLLTASAEVLDQLGVMVSSKSKAPSARAMNEGVQKTVRRLKGRLTTLELRILRDVAIALASEVDQLLSQVEDPEQAEAAAVDRAVRAVLDAARRANGPAAPMATLKSIREGDKFRAHAAEVAMASAKRRIAAGELITSGDLRRKLDVSRQAVKTAIDAHRLFAILGPSGENYYPAFYAEDGIDRRAVEKVSKILGALPGSVKYGFFTAKSEQLGDTPLEALRKGRVESVLKMAAGFMTR